MLKELLIKSRSYRRFEQNHKIDYSELSELVELTRYAPSTVNSQPLKFKIVNTKLTEQ